MRYIMLLWPHANARYQSETVHLAEAELPLMLDRLAPGTAVSRDTGLPMPSLAIDFADAPDAPVLEALRAHSLLYALFAQRDGLLEPVTGRMCARVGEDLPAILKYKGKTNEMFLQLLINAALYAGDFWPRAGERLSFLDPMCGRATSLFVAANYGWDATGADVDRADLREAEKFFKRYLEYHRFKHAVSRESRTLKKGQAQVTRFEYAPDAESFKSGGARALSLVNLDAAQAEHALGKGIGTQAVGMMTELLRREKGIEIITASSMIENRASARILEKNGFTLVVHAAEEDWGFGTPTPADKWIL